MNSISILLVMLVMATTESKSNGFKAERIADEATIQLNGPIDMVFPLFGPVREMDWAPGWNPEIIFSTTNEVDEHMIFRTKGKFENESFYTWAVTQYCPERYLIEYTVSTSERIWFIRVQCKPAGEITTSAVVSYTFTALTERGNELNKVALSGMYKNRLKDWEEAINHYLHYGTRISD